MKLHACQLEHDSFAHTHDIEVAGNRQERERLRFARISSLIAKKLCIDHNTGSLYTGYRSINCENCVLGRTQGINLTEYCSRNCFYCPQRRSPQTCFTRQLNYYTPTEEKDRKIINAMKINDSTGCGLTGGEPLVVYDKVLHYIRLLKKHMGKGFWIHLYTNGDFLQTSTLQELKNAGLDEIRINTAAVDYNLEKVALSRQYIPKLLIEIPVIPEDGKKIERMMLELDKLEIDGLNLHELVFNSHNAEQMGHYLAAYPSYKVPFYLLNEAPVLGSEELILDLLDLGLTKKLSYGIHYCYYRARIIKQNIFKHYRIALKTRRPYEQVNGDGLLEKLVIPEPGIADTLAELEKHGVPKEKIHLSRSKKRLETDKDYLKFLDPGKYEIALVRSLPYGKFDDISIKIVG